MTYHDYSGAPKPVTNDELLEAVSSYGESGNAQNERLVFLTPRLHLALVEHFRRRREELTYSSTNHPQ